jgi:hypothetical protein
MLNQNNGNFKFHLNFYTVGKLSKVTHHSHHRPMMSCCHLHGPGLMLQPVVAQSDSLPFRFCEQSVGFFNLKRFSQKSVLFTNYTFYNDETEFLFVV